VVYGRVTLPNGSPASRVTVRVERQGGVGRQTITDDSGRFEVADLARGRYYVVAENPADPDQFAEPVEAETGRSPGTRIRADIYLRYRGKTVRAREQGGAVTVSEQTQVIPKQARKSFDQALHLRNERQLQKSLESFNHALEQFPDYVQALAERGHLRIGMGQVAEASGDFARALAVNPGFGRALLGAGMCSFQQGKFTEAAQHLEKAAQADPGSATTFLFLGITDAALDRREQARGNLQKALAIDPSGCARAHVHLANLSIKENRPQEAVSEIEAYLATAPNAPDAEKLRSIAARLGGTK
jgi:tetratricopeptide (TPR) repeat protein